MNPLAALARAVTRSDSWLNLTTGVGSMLGRAGFTFAREVRQDDQLLEDIFHGDAYASRICRAVPEEATRQGFKVSTGDVDVESALAARLADLEAVPRIIEAWTWARVFGGGALFVGADDGRDPRDPLDEANIRSIRFLVSLDKRELYPLTWEDDPLSPRYGSPAVYNLQRVGGTTVETRPVHASRIIRFEGSITTRRRKRQLNWWGESELERVRDKLVAFNGAFAAVGTLLQDASQGVFGIENLYSMLDADKDDTLKKRLALMDMTRGVGRAVMIDKDAETFTRTESSALSGMPLTLDKFLLYLAGAAEIPVTILMGQAPAGLSATGDSDIRWFYDRIKSQQENTMRPRLERLVRLVMLAQDGPCRGQEPPAWSIRFAPLYQMTPLEEATLRDKIADTDGKYVAMQAITPEEVAVNRFPPEGYDTETSIDLAARKAILEADAAEGSTGTSPEDAPGSEHADAIAAVIARVASREIPRDAGVQILVTSLGLSAEVADQVMGAAGVTHFTTPDPAATAELDSLKTEHASLQRSHTSTSAMLKSVLARNKAGELVTGNLFGAAARREPNVAPSGGDDVPGVAEGTLAPDAPRLPKPVPMMGVDGREDGDAPHVAIVLPLPAYVADRVAIVGGEASAELHITLAYLGRLALSAEDVATITGVLDAWASAHAPLPVTLAGVGRFVGTDPAKGDPVYRAVDSVDLAADRAALVKALADAGYPTRTTHEYTPHVTLAYMPAGARSPVTRAEPLSMELDTVALWAGETRVNVKLGGAA